MGGAKNCPETPRQKMISMMYLVLTAMLALNVSAAILNGYAQVDESLHATITTMNESNNETYNHFKALMITEKAVQVGPFYEAALEVQRKSNEFYDYVQKFKDEMVEQAEGEAKPNAHVRDLKKQDDTNVPQRYAINEGNAAILKGKINEYREFMIDITGNSPALDEELRQTFTTPGGVNAEGEPISWEDAMFNEMPMCACVTVLTKLQNDIRHCEGRAIRYLLTLTDASDVRVNKFDAYVIPSSDNVVKGNTYKAQIILAASDTTRVPQYYVNGKELKHGLYEVQANNVGLQKFTGQIGYKDNQGVMQYISFERSYNVVEPSATVSNMDLNIMYRGYDNPFSISVPGVDNKDLIVECKQATITTKNDRWIIKPSDKAPDNLTIEVYAKINNRKLLMGSHVYRIKNLPRPDAYLEIKGEIVEEETKFSRADLLDKDTKIVASYGADGLIQAKFEITGFQVKLPTGRAISVEGSKFSEDVRKRIEKLTQDNSINIMYIKAKGPDGKEVQLRGIPIVLK